MKNNKEENKIQETDLNSKSVKPIKISIYLTVLTGLLIIVTTSLFAFYTIFSIRDLAAEYESQISNLRQLVMRITVQSLKTDEQKNDFSTTTSIINLLKKDDMLVYAYVQDEAADKIVFKDSDETEVNFLKKLNSYSDEVIDLQSVFGKYTVHLGVSETNNLKEYSGKFFKSILQILLAFLLLGILISLYIASIVSKPLEKLSKAVKQVSGANFDIKLKETPVTEINDLIYSYNKMGFELNELYSSLEQKVQERTDALEKANHKLKETQAMMVHSEKMRSLGELVAGIAHEINNPVNFIHGNIMILQNYADDLFNLIDLYEENNIDFPPEAKSKIEALRKQIDVDFLRGDIKDLIKSCIEGTERTKNIVLDLKNFSRMEEMVISQIDIPKEIDTTLNILNNKYKNRITVVKNYSPEVPKIEAFGGQLNQVFMNILDNAQDAMGEVGTLTINLDKIEENKIKLEFIDTGSGIDPENIKKVFDPFFTTKAVGKGTGLGMSISYRVINDHKGTINVESEVGKGTKFTITLPINQNITEKLEIEDGAKNG